MNWLQKSIQQIKRIFPDSTLSEGSTEAEFTDFLEQQSSMVEILESSEALGEVTSQLTKLKSQVEALKGVKAVDLTDYVTQESLDSSIESVTTSLTEKLTVSTAALKSTISTEINKVKGSSSAHQSSSSAAVPGKGDGEGNEDVGSFNMADMEVTQTIPGVL